MNMPNDDLISRKALIEQIEEDAKHMMFTSHHSRILHDDTVEFAINAIECAPAVDAEPVHKKPLIASIMETMNHMDENARKGGHQSNTARRGKWILFGRNYAMCSECKLKRNISTQVAWEYCPKCGEKMDFKEDTPCTQQ